MAEEGTYHKGAIAHPHEADFGIRGGHMIREAGEEGETALLRCGTSTGKFVAMLHRDWSPNGYDRVTALFEKGFYDDSHFFRVVPKFLVQFGISYTDKKSLLQFANTPIKDDPQLSPPRQFHKGTMAFAGSGPNSRTSQLFISYGTNPGLGKEKWETPFGEVIEGMENVEKLYSYGDMPPWGKGPVQQKIRNNPNYVKDQFPMLDKFGKCEIEIRKIKAAIGDIDGAATRKEQRALEKAGNQADDPVEVEQRQVKAEADSSQNKFGPFDDMMQLGAVGAGVAVLMLLIIALSRRKGGKTHSQ